MCIETVWSLLIIVALAYSTCVVIKIFAEQNASILMGNVLVVFICHVRDPELTAENAH